MTAWQTSLDRMRNAIQDRTDRIRPTYPGAAVEIGPAEIVLVRLKPRRRGKPTLEAHQSRPTPEDAGGTSIFRPTLSSTEPIIDRVRELFEKTGTKPGRVSIVIPDNLAKISIVNLPERPASRRQLDELVRFKLRRAVPFRLEEAAITYQLLPTRDRGVDVLVAVMRRFVVEQYEGVLAAVGARPGLVDLCTPNVLNLAQSRLTALAGDGRDVAFLNCAYGYFTLVILRGGRPIFYRCKSLAHADEDPAAPIDDVVREVVNSFAYYRDKLEGSEIAALLVRSVSYPLDAVLDRLAGGEFGTVEAFDPTSELGLPEGVRVDPEVGQRIAPAAGAAAGRS